jgi:hypothetical protein
MSRETRLGTSIGELSAPSGGFVGEGKGEKKKERRKKRKKKEERRKKKDGEINSPLQGLGQGWCGRRDLNPQDLSATRS